jgi:magnesium transporter
MSLPEPAVTAAPMAIRITILNDRELVQGGLELLGDWNEERTDCLWIDITSPNQADIEPLLEEWFRFHELAAEDALSPNTLPKYDQFPRYDFFVFRSIALNLVEHGIDSEKISCFLGKNFLFTIHRNPMPSADAIWTRIPHDARIMKRGVDFVLYSILDDLVDQHFPLLDEIEERLDHIHELIFEQPSQTLLDELLDFKRDLNVLRRQSLPQRELLNQISRGGAQFIRQEHLIYFRDLYDHMYRIGESIDVERDLATSTMEAYLSVVANRTNDIMKVLTIFSSVMLPINFIASIYGMNFEHMPELGWKFGYLWAVGLMSCVAIGMLTWFQRRGWLFPRRIDVRPPRRALRSARKEPHLTEQRAGHIVSTHNG